MAPRVGADLESDTKAESVWSPRTAPLCNVCLQSTAIATCVYWAAPAVPATHPPLPPRSCFRSLERSWSVTWQEGACFPAAAEKQTLTDPFASAHVACKQPPAHHVCRYQANFILRIIRLATELVFLGEGQTFMSTLSASTSQMLSGWSHLVCINECCWRWNLSPKSLSLPHVWQGRWRRVKAIINRNQRGMVPSTSTPQHNPHKNCRQNTLHALNPETSCMLPRGYKAPLAWKGVVLA